MTSFLDSFSFQTRYRGSKVKIIPAIFNTVKDLNFSTVLDLFAGSGAVSYLFKKMNKRVIFNDHLKFNHIIGRAIIENSDIMLSKSDIQFVLKPRSYENYPHLIENQFKDIYNTDEENKWLDRIICNIGEMKQGYAKDMAYWCLFQSCITKRPFSLFHRKNLNLRTSNVKRSFGNKVTWDTSFEIHFRRFAEELNRYIIKTKYECTALNFDVMEVPLDICQEGFHLIYIDPPYIPIKGENIIYRDLYHFLEGITQYETWESQIDYKSKHKRIKPLYNIWNDKKNVITAFKKLLNRYNESDILLSHRSEGIPSTDELIQLLKDNWAKVSVVEKIEHKYALSTRDSDEVLILAQK